MSFTDAQQDAITARGNVLVVAGAGTGKTRTLVERCMDCLVREQPPASLDQMLVVTFTEAAATEIRHRIRDRLEAQLAEQPDKLHWPEQLALFDAANIGTLHSFCLKLIRQHFYELELDPQLTVMPEEEARLLAEEVLANLLDARYRKTDDDAVAVQQLIQAHGQGSDQPIRTLVLKLHHYTQTLRDPEGWLDEQAKMFESSEPTLWREWLREGIADWQARWLDILQSQAPENLKAAECAAMLRKMPSRPSSEKLASLFQSLEAIDGDWPRGKTTAWRKPIEDLFQDAAFLRSLIGADGGPHPLSEDWNWVRGQMATLLKLTREFGAAFAHAKREQAAVDFHDLEQHALELLWDRATKQPTAIAQHWRSQLRFVFVDEYQDINEAQDAILTALSREGAAANRFLVGDVKQSIYRFRLAAPHIFQAYAKAWDGPAGKVIPLSHNFRSREAILDFVNAAFTALMRPEIGGIAYDELARLQFGNPKDRYDLSLDCDASPRVELHLLLKGTADGGDSDEDAARRTEAVNLEDSSKEARIAARRLIELKNGGHQIWDEETGDIRPVEWNDMAVLLRSPAGKSENFTKEFARLSVPLTIARSGFYETMEIADLISLLQLLDNPLQDVPTIAVLHSPLAGLSAEELAVIRLVAPGERFWTALQRFNESRMEHAAWPKADRFIKNFARWRRLARQVSLSRCLETVLGETHYIAWLLTQSRGEQRHANVQRLLALARQFDQFQRQGLSRFLRFVEAQKTAETEPTVAPVSGGNSVTLMSIHQSKGLEFPVVVVADLGKTFNFSDLKAEIILDDKYGLCPRIKPPHTGRRYPSLPYWLAQRRQKQETLGEELRLLYVAMTRARDTLILTGTLPAKKFEGHWLKPANQTTTPQLSARNYLDWLAQWTTLSTDTLLSASEDKNRLFSWALYDSSDKRLLEVPKPVSAATKSSATSNRGNNWRRDLQRRLGWKYPHAASTHEPAKTSVTAVRRRIAEEPDDAAAPFLRFQIKAKTTAPRTRLSATEAGLAHHTFLQFVSIERTGSAAELKQEAARLSQEGFLSKEEAAALDLEALAAFWQSELGKKIRGEEENVRRELEFTARFSPQELGGLKIYTNGKRGPLAPDRSPDGGEGEEDYVIVQGAADLMILLADEIWIVDFKTDRFPESEVAAKVTFYEPQLRLYAMALSRIYRRPVTGLYLHFLSLRRTVPLKVE